MANDMGQPPIALTAREWEVLSAVLEACLPKAQVWAFGSRATGDHLKRFSDLDLVVDGADVSPSALARLDDTLEESSLPFKVDVSELRLLTPEFRERIAKQMVPLPNTVVAQVTA